MIKKYKNFLKPISIILLTNATLYFTIKIFIKNFHTLSPIITFKLIPSFSFIYNSWYPFIFLIAFLIYKKDKNSFNHFIITVFIGIILSNLTFILYPTYLGRPNITSNTISTLLLKLTYKLDSPPINCIPSVHCLLSFIIAYYITFKTTLQKKYKLLITLYSFLIILSTLLIRQHLLTDVLVALLYTIISTVLTYKFYEKLKRALNFLF